jgi:NAD(P)H-dependent FMN reductase
VLIATPQHNASLPCQLKNALVGPRGRVRTACCKGKPFAVSGASPSPTGATRAQAEARVVLGATGAQMIDAELLLARAHEQFDDTGIARPAHEAVTQRKPRKGSHRSERSDVNRGRRRRGSRS